MLAALPSTDDLDESDLVQQARNAGPLAPLGVLFRAEGVEARRKEADCSRNPYPLGSTQRALWCIGWHSVPGHHQCTTLASPEVS
jgi:hypothetical protein